MIKQSIHKSYLYLSHNFTIMPIISTQKVACPHCPNVFKNLHSLNRHQYHNPFICGSYTSSSIVAINSFSKTNSHLPNKNKINQIINNDKTFSDSIPQTTTSPMAIENSFNNDNNDTNSTTSDTDKCQNLFFQVTSSHHEENTGLPKQVILPNAFVDQCLHVKLLHLLDKDEAPDYLFKAIIQWASSAKELNYNFSPRFTTGSAVLTGLQNHFNMKNQCPIVKLLKLESISPAILIVSFDVKLQLFSLLNNTTLMQSENLVINTQYLAAGQNDYPPWFPPYRPVDKNVDEVLSGMWYKTTAEKLLIEDPKAFLCPLILYVDKIFIDPMRSCFNLEPFDFTLALFNNKCRSKFAFWRTLGYVREVRDCNEQKLADSYKPQNYHTLLTSQHKIPNHAFQNIDFGVNIHGISGATPNDILHGLKLGIIHYIMEVFLTDLKGKASNYLDMALKETLPHLKQGGNQHFPRLYFPNGITSLSNVTADESHGILFVTYLLCLTKQGKDALAHAKNMTNKRIEEYLLVFEQLLVFHAWMSHAGYYWAPDDDRAEKAAYRAISKLMNFINKTFKREKQGWNISKFHELLHVPRFITLFGAPSNFDSGPCERMHKEVAKQPGRRSQKRHETFSYQAAKRLTEKHVLDLALNQLEKQPPTTSEEPAKSSSAGSQFVLICKLQANHNTLQPPVYNVSIKGLGLLANDKLLDKKLYPDLIQFIVVYLSGLNHKFESPILCCTEIVD